MRASVEDGQFAALPNGTRLHYASAGQRGAPLMLFLHGFPEAWFEWQAQLEEFGTDHFAVAPDLRGFNLSSKPSAVEAYRHKHLVADLRELVAALDYRDAVVVAHDWGGALAWNLTIFHPAEVRRLIIVNSPHPYLFMRDLARDPAQQAASAYMNWLRAPGAEEALAQDGFARLHAMFRETSSAAERWYTPAVAARYARAWSVPGEAGSHSLTGSVNYYRATPLRPPPGDAAAEAFARTRAEDWRVTVPVRVIWGDADRALLPGLIDGLEALCDDLRVTHIPHGTHWVIHEEPELVNGLMRRALTD